MPFTPPGIPEMIRDYLAALSADGGVTLRAALGDDTPDPTLAPLLSLAKLPDRGRRALAGVASLVGQGRLGSMLDAMGEKDVATLWQITDRLRGWRFAVVHFRGCSGEPNLTARAYHSGDFEEIGWILERFRQRHAGPRLAVGVSLGGNALLRWAEECGEFASRCTDAIAAVSSPVDLAAGGLAIGRGFNRHVYTRMFMRSLRPKVLRKLEHFPGLFDSARMLAARDLFEFDNLYTAPVHGFRDTHDYWRRASAKPHLRSIRIPALLLNAVNDPFVPAASLPLTTEVGPAVTLWQPPHGGHGGFASGAFPGHLDGVPSRVMDWLQSPSGAHDAGALRRG
jgi:predicted alpha/beta-fold hydrolase